MSFYLYICVCLFNRFLIFKLLIKGLIITNAGIAPSGTMGLRKPPGSLLPACLFLCLRQCELLKHVTWLKKMQLSKSDSAFSLWMRSESSKNINSYFGSLLGKAEASACFGWKVPAPPSFCQSRLLLRSHLSSGLRSAFGHVREGRTH